MNGMHKAMVIKIAYSKLLSSVGKPSLIAIVTITKYIILPAATEMSQFLNVLLPKIASPTRMDAKPITK